MMTMEYKQSLTELNIILNYMDIELIKKIPTKLITFIGQNMDTSYTPNINQDTPINEQQLKKETKVLLSLIYRDYLVDNEKKKVLIEQDLLEKQKNEEKLKEKYNPNNLFENKIQDIELKEEIEPKNVEMIEYKKPKWYQKLFTKILKFFKKN